MRLRARALGLSSSTTSTSFFSSTTTTTTTTMKTKSTTPAHSPLSRRSITNPSSTRKKNRETIHQLDRLEENRVAVIGFRNRISTPLFDPKTAFSRNGRRLGGGGGPRRLRERITGFLTRFRWVRFGRAFHQIRRQDSNELQERERFPAFFFCGAFRLPSFRNRTVPNFGQLCRIASV